jgi:hypothetical protein
MNALIFSTSRSCAAESNTRQIYCPSLLKGPEETMHVALCLKLKRVAMVQNPAPDFCTGAVPRGTEIAPVQFCGTGATERYRV